MAPLPNSEKYKLLENISELKARKLSFEINKIQLPKGHCGNYGIIKHPGAALAVPINDKGEIIILNQYRFAIQSRILEFPAGTLEEGENPLSTIKRELAEESGFIAKKWDELGLMIPCPGYSDEKIHLFLARDLEELSEIPKGDEDEDIEVLRMTPEKLNSIISSGKEALDGKTISAWFRALQFLNLNER